MLQRAVHSQFRFGGLDDLRAAVDELELRIDIEENLSYLAQPVNLPGGIAPNSMAIQPMEGCDAEPDGAPGPLTFRRYQRFARGGAGLIWFEACAVTLQVRANPRQLCLHKDNEQAFSALLRQTLASADNRLFTVLQLTCSGRYTRPESKPTPLIVFHEPKLDALSGIPPSWPLITDEELEELETAYVEAARLASNVGFDAVDIKACHGYLVNELLAAHTRSGRYGGDYENRTRFLKNVVNRIRREVGIVVACRLGVYDAYPYPYGWGVSQHNPAIPDLTEPKQLVRDLYEMGVRLMNFTAGNPYRAPHVNRPFDWPEEGAPIPQEHPLVGIERLINLTRELRQSLPDLIIVGSGYSWLRNLWPYVAAAELKQHYIRIVGLGRQAFAYPNFAKEIIETGKLDAKHTCIACSSCTQIMRDGGTTGCVPLDSHVYAPIYRTGRRLSLNYIRAQATRCRNCFQPRCMEGCPAAVDIPGFIGAVAEDDLRRSYEILTARNVLPELCGYTCPAEVQCCGNCIEGVFSESPVPINEIQVFVARMARNNGWAQLSPHIQSSGKRIAIIGAGPAGLACAASLLKLGHRVEVYDSAHHSGGLPATVIPPERLDVRNFQAEIEAIFGAVRDERFFYHPGELLGSSLLLDDLLLKHDAVFLAIGLMGSESLSDSRSPGVITAMEFLKNRTFDIIPDTVAVLGGGNSALDAALKAIQVGAQDVYLVYRRSFAEMPGWFHIRDIALRKGIHFLILTQPIGYELHDGLLQGVWVAPMKLAEPDESGRRRPIPAYDTKWLLEVGLVIEAFGQKLPPDMEAFLPGIALTEDRLVEVDYWGRTSRQGVYAGGDLVNGGATVVQAVVEGMRAANAIHEDLVSQSP